MCGICGFAGIQNPELLKNMTDAIYHRGPNSDGVFTQGNNTLGARRLSIIDIEKGDQPITNEDGTVVVVYNGEIYNYIELREELKNLGWGFRTKTDTEVLLKTYQQYGEACLPKFNGMFAFVIYDTVQHSIFLARDRVGIKPLYYTIIDTGLYFTSEIKALCQVPALKLSLNHQRASKMR